MIVAIGRNMCHCGTELVVCQITDENQLHERARVAYHGKASFLITVEKLIELGTDADARLREWLEEVHQDQRAKNAHHAGL